LAQLYASSYPERVLGLLYVAGTGIEWPKWRPQHRAEVERRRALPAYAEIARSAEHPNILRWAIDFADPDVGRRRAEEMAATGYEVNMTCNSALNAELSAIPSEEWLARCARIQAPVVVIQGSEDPRPVAAVDSMLAALPSAVRAVLPGAGHYPWVERPLEFVSGVQRLVSRT
jgi:proline iminopeptidase